MGRDWFRCGCGFLLIATTSRRIRAQHRDRLAFDQRLGGNLDRRQSGAEFGAAPANRRVATKLGIIADPECQLAQQRADLSHIDGVLRVMAADVDPESIRPKRVYRRIQYFARNELSRLCLSALQVAAEELVTADFIGEGGRN